MFFDDTTTVLDITQNSYDDDKTLILNGKERLKYFTDHYCSQPVLSPLAKKRRALLNTVKKLLKR